MKPKTALFVSILLITLAGRVMAEYNPEEMVLICRGSTRFVQELAKADALQKAWHWGDIGITDARRVETTMGDGRPATVYVRDFLLVESGPKSDLRQDRKIETHFQVRGTPRPDEQFRSSGEFLHTVLDKWEWYKVSGTLAYQHDLRETGQNRVVCPCKLPASWIKHLEQVMVLRAEKKAWFETLPDAGEIQKLKASLHSTNPIFRLCVACRLLNIGALNEQECDNMLRMAGGDVVACASGLVLLLNDTHSHEDMILRMLHQDETVDLLGEGLALGLLSNSVSRPRSIELALMNWEFKKKHPPEKAESESERRKAVDAFFPGADAREFRIALKMNKVLQTNPFLQANSNHQVLLQYMFAP